MEDFKLLYWAQGKALFGRLNQMIHEPTGHIMTVKVHHTHCKLVWIIDICSCFFLMSVTRKQESLTSFCLLYNQILDVSSTNEREMLLNAFEWLCGAQNRLPAHRNYLWCYG